MSVFLPNNIMQQQVIGLQPMASVGMHPMTGLNVTDVQLLGPSYQQQAQAILYLMTQGANKESSTEDKKKTENKPKSTHFMAGTTGVTITPPSKARFEEPSFSTPEKKDDKIESDDATEEEKAKKIEEEKKKKVTFAEGTKLSNKLRKINNDKNKLISLMKSRYDLFIQISKDIDNKDNIKFYEDKKEKLVGMGEQNIQLGSSNLALMGSSNLALHAGGNDNEGIVLDIDDKKLNEYSAELDKMKNNFLDILKDDIKEFKNI